MSIPPVLPDRPLYLEGGPGNLAGSHLGAGERRADALVAERRPCKRGLRRRTPKWTLSVARLETKQAFTGAVAVERGCGCSEHG